MDAEKQELRKITLPIPDKPWFFWHICEAPPKDINLIDLALNHEKFLATAKDTGKEYIIERIDFFVYKTGEPIPFYVICMALDMDEMEAKEYIKKTYGGKPIAFFLF